MGRESRKDWADLKFRETFPDDESPEIVEDANCEEEEPIKVEIPVWVNNGQWKTPFLLSAVLGLTPPAPTAPIILPNLKRLLGKSKDTQKWVSKHTERRRN